MATHVGRFRWFACFLLAALVLVAATGCVKETTDGDKTVFTLAWWAPLSVMLGGLVAAPSGWFLRAVSNRLAFGLMIGGPFAILLGLSLYTDRTEVDPNGFKGRMGIFGSKKFEAQFDNISSMALVTRRSRRSSSDFIVFHTKDGQQDEFSIGNSMTERAAPLILDYAQAKGVPITDER